MATTPPARLPAWMRERDHLYLAGRLSASAPSDALVAAGHAARAAADDGAPPDVVAYEAVWAARPLLLADELLWVAADLDSAGMPGAAAAVRARAVAVFGSAETPR
ncbi:MAG: hypothetical protein ACRCZP_20090 [Phycicoccus sp.]